MPSLGSARRPNLQVGWAPQKTFNFFCLNAFKATLYGLITIFVPQWLDILRLQPIDAVGPITERHSCKIFHES